MPNLATATSHELIHELLSRDSEYLVLEIVPQADHRPEIRPHASRTLEIRSAVNLLQAAASKFESDPNWFCSCLH